MARKLTYLDFVGEFSLDNGENWRRACFTEFSVDTNAEKIDATTMCDAIVKYLLTTVEVTCSFSIIKEDESAIVRRLDLMPFEKRTIPFRFSWENAPNAPRFTGNMLIDSVSTSTSAKEKVDVSYSATLQDFAHSNIPQLQQFEPWWATYLQCQG